MLILFSFCPVIQLRTQEALPESGLLITVSWRPAVFLELQPINVRLRGSAAANAYFRLLKNQPQHRHLWPLCLHSQHQPPPTLHSTHHTSLPCPARPLPLPPSSLESASILPSSGQYVHSIICTLSLTKLPSPPLQLPVTLCPLPPHVLPSLSDTVSSLPCRVCDRRKGLKCASGGFSDVCPTDGAGWRCS